MVRSESYFLSPKLDFHLIFKLDFEILAKQKVGLKKMTAAKRIREISKDWGVPTSQMWIDRYGSRSLLHSHLSQIKIHLPKVIAQDFGSLGILDIDSKLLILWRRYPPKKRIFSKFIQETKVTSLCQQSSQDSSRSNKMAASNSDSKTLFTYISLFYNMQCKTF